MIIHFTEEAWAARSVSNLFFPPGTLNPTTARRAEGISAAIINEADQGIIWRRIPTAY